MRPMFHAGKCYPTDNQMFKVNNEHVSHLVLPFLLITLSRKMRAGLAVHEAPKAGNHINLRAFVK